MGPSTLTTRIDQETPEDVRASATESAEPMSAIVAEAVRDYRRQQFWREYHAAYAALNADPVASAEHRGELEDWDSTIADGLDD